MPPKKASRGKGKSKTDNDTSNDQVNGVVIQLRFSSMEKMALALARVSIYLEDPNHEGTPISLSEIADIDAPAKRYAGHNFPLPSYDEAISQLGQLSQYEKTIHSIINEKARYIRPRSNAYIIAFVDGDDGTFGHEKLHAIYYFNPAYQKRIQGVWAAVQRSHPSWAKQFSEHLGTMYCERVHVDEFQAIITSREYECVSQIQQLLDSTIPKGDTPGFVVTDAGIVL